MAEAGAGAAPRSAIRRIGLLLLNIPTPGAGLMRAGGAQSAVVVFALPVALALVVAAVYGFVDEMTFPVFAPLMIGILVLWLLNFVVAFTLTWRASRVRPLRHPWYARWYTIVAMVLANAAVGEAVVRIVNINYRNFYIPAESMLPALHVGDRLVADMRQPVRLGRGDIAIYRHQGMDYVHRIVAVGGDRVAVRTGRLVVNGAAAILERQGRIVTDRGAAALYRETLPGQSARQIIDLEPKSYADDYPERAIPPGFVFVMGDHRDNAADSRVPVEVVGAGLVPVDHIIGKASFIYWSRDHSRIGAELD